MEIHNKQYIDVSSNADFGFSFTDEEELVRLSKESAHLVDQIKDLKIRLEKLRYMFLPLLTKLNESPEKELIRWPNRKEIIEEQIERLKNLTNL